MGYGDELMATGFARGAAARGKRIAFGDGKQILWTHHSPEIFRGNPNIAQPGTERASDVEWVPFYRGNRLYNRQDDEHSRWIWNYDFRPPRGELFFEKRELERGLAGKGCVILESSIPFKRSAVNKRWPLARWARLARLLERDGLQVRQFSHSMRTGGDMVQGVREIYTATFREAAAVLREAMLVITPEGGLHHAAAAVGTPAVVLFGSFIPPQVTGYEGHENIAVGEPCGKYVPCNHCRAAMEQISSETVHEAARRLLNGRA